MDMTIEEVLEEYKDLVRSKAGLYFMLGAEKEDLIQEGMIGLVKAYNTYDPSRGASFKTFAELCITRQMITAVKAAGRQKNTPLNSAVSLDGPENDAEDAPALGEILAAGSDSDPESLILFQELTELLRSPGNGYFSPFEQRVLQLLISGCKYKEIAQILGKTPKQADNAIQRIRLKIKALL